MSKKMKTLSKTILVVDDEADVLEIVAEMIADMGYQVKAVSNGKAAQDLVSKTPVDMVLLDLNMQGIDGLTLARWLRDRFPSLPLAMMTAYPVSELQTFLRQRLINSLLSKPLNMGELRGAVQTLIARPA